MKIKVTQEHIDNGWRCSRGWCPIALALRDVFGRDCDPRVSGVHIALGPGTSYRTPPEAMYFISDYDDGRTVQPFEFELEPAPKIL